MTESEFNRSVSGAVTANMNATFTRQWNHILNPLALQKLQCLVSVWYKRVHQKGIMYKDEIYHYSE